MSALGFTDQRNRLRRIVENALAGTSYESSRRENGSILVVEARRPGGIQVVVRFRGVRDSSSDSEPIAGSEIRRLDVGSAEGFSLVRLFFPFLRGPGSGATRVRIHAGSTRLEIVCEDADWWEPDGSRETSER